MTVWFKPPVEMVKNLQEKDFFGRKIDLHVSCIASDKQCVAAIIKEDVLFDVEIQAEIPHITITTADNIAPVYSNQMLVKNNKDIETVDLHLRGTIKLHTWQ